MSNTQFAIVVSQFNPAITDELLAGALAQFKTYNVPCDAITIIHVPGAVEIPLTAQRLAKTNRYAAIICLGAVIRGETTHYDYVCEQVSQGCQHVMLEYDLPVIFGVLTTENAEQARDRIGGAHGHKGKESVETAFAMLEVLAGIGA